MHWAGSLAQVATGCTLLNRVLSCKRLQRQAKLHRSTSWEQDMTEKPSRDGWRDRGLLLAATAVVSLVATLGPADAAGPLDASMHGATGFDSASVSIRSMTGTLNDGSTYLFEVPSNWNGTLFLYSHGVQFSPTPVAQDAIDGVTGGWLLDQGFALGGGSYPVTGYQPMVQYASQLATLDAFQQMVGRPTRTIAWGASIGSIITTQLIEAAPQRFAAALPLCGFMAETIGTMNSRLDHAFVIHTLLDSSLPLVDIGFGKGQVSRASALEAQILSAAQQTPQGRARIALAEAMVNTPDIYALTTNGTFPPTTSYDLREANQYQWAINYGIYQDEGRGELEHLVGDWNSSTGTVTNGNVSWNSGVDYSLQLQRSRNADEVSALYAKAGISLQADLQALAQAQKITADPGAVNRSYSVLPTYSGRNGGIPVLTVTTTGDGLTGPDSDSSYATLASSRGYSDTVRTLFTRRSGHCAFTPAELIVAVKALLSRLDAGSWGSLDPATLDAQAAALPEGFNKLTKYPNVVDPGYTTFDWRFQRMFDPLNPPPACSCTALT